MNRWVTLGGVAAMAIATSVAYADVPAIPDPVFATAKSWMEALRRRDTAAVLDSTSLPFTHRSIGLKQKCERSAKNRDELQRWIDCLLNSKDLLLGELGAGDDVEIEQDLHPSPRALKVFKKLQEGLPDGEWAAAYLNGDGVTFTLRFLIVKSPDGRRRVAAFLMKAFFETA
jgi:hypothetical protein